jgi:exonuclease III
LHYPPSLPQVICLTEHHLTTEQISTIKLDQYTLGASFCRQTYKHGGTCIYVSKDIQFHAINLDQFNTEKDLEICALRSSLTPCNLAIICIYRSPIGNFSYFLNQLETVLNKLHKTSTELIVCGDFNVNYFNDNSRKLLLDSLFASYSLFSTVNFPTRNFKNSSSLIDNIYINTYTHDFSVQPFII